VSETVAFPVDAAVAHEVVRAQLDDREPSRDVNPRLAACACLRSNNPAFQSDGAELLAALADEDGKHVQAASYDLAAVLDADDRLTRAHAMGAFQVAVHMLPQTGVDRLDVVVARLADVDPLVREAAASTVAWVANAVRDDTRGDFPNGTRAAFEPAVDPLLDVLDADADDGRFEWTTQFAVSHPTRTFWGPVDSGVSRRAENRWQATFAVAMLADWFPDRVESHADVLVELAETGDRAETRWYAVDALARVDADDALGAVRDRARHALEDSERAATGVETLYHFITERPAMLVPAHPDLLIALGNLDADSQSSAVVAMLHGAIHHPDLGETCRLVREIVGEWLQDGDDEPSRSVPVGPGPIADLAVAHPRCVLPVVSKALDVPLATNALPGNGFAGNGFVGNGSATDELGVRGVAEDELAESDAPMAWSPSGGESWAEDDAWRVLREVAKRDRALLWDALESGWLRERLDREGDWGGQVRRLYARTVPTPLPEAAVVALFESVLAGLDGARGALSTLFERAPDAVVEAAVDAIEGAPAPSGDALAVLESISNAAPGALAPRTETLWSWTDVIRPTDDRWSDLVTVLGRVAVATDDRDRISRLLHLEDATYCTHLLDTPVASAVIRAAPHKAVPALLDHLDRAAPRLRSRIVRHFESFPGDLEGWEPTVRDAIVDAATDANRRVRTVAVRTLGAWLEALARIDSQDYEGRSTTVRAALLDRLTDEDWRVRARAVRALAADTNSKTRTSLETTLASEGNQNIRFEIQRVLHGRDKGTTNSH
jgi:hypothetical protein